MDTLCATFYLQVAFKEEINSQKEKVYIVHTTQHMKVGQISEKFHEKTKTMTLKYANL